MSESLKSCPFCGGEAEFHVIANSASHVGASFTFKIVCSECKVSSPKQHTIGVDMNSTGAIVARHDEREIAINEWNQRVGDTP